MPDLSKKAIKLLMKPVVFSPIGASFQENFLLPEAQKDKSLWEPILRTLEAIASVHHDGELPVIPIEISNSRKMAGYYDKIRLSDGSDQSRGVRIGLSRYTSHPEFTLCHEIAHYISHNGWMSTESAAEEWPNIEWEQWAFAVFKSNAFKDLSTMRKSGYHYVYQADGKSVEVNVSRSAIEYLLNAEELWARSYAQYIATKSQYPLLCQQLNDERSLRVGAVYYPQQWTDKDFEPILESIDRILRERGWLYAC
jgi:hypothetical protein